MKRKLILIVILLTCSLWLSSALAYDSNQPIKYARYPAISPNGKTIAFCFLGDIWTVPVEGGKATRITDHIANDILPVWSPDGRHIAFSSERYGNYDIFVIPAEGGIPKRITYHTSTDYVTSWSPDGKEILFYSWRFGRTKNLYRVNASGGTPRKIASFWLEPNFFAKYSPDGKTIAFNNGAGESRWWKKNYRGSENSDILIANLDAKDLSIEKITHFEGNDLWPMWSGDGNRIYFVSDRDGIANLWSISTKGNNPTQITFHKEDGIQWPNISLNGNAIVYEYDFGIWVKNSDEEESREIKIYAPSDEKENTIREEIYSNKVTQYKLSPNGKMIGFVVYGEIFVIPTDEKMEARRLTNNFARDWQINWSPNNKNIVFVSDRNGNYDLFTVDIKTKEEIQLTSTEEDETKPDFSPDGKSIAFYKDNEGIYLIPAEGGKAKSLIEDDLIDLPVETTFEFDWSPDGKWMAYTKFGESYYTDIWVKSLKSEVNQNITQKGGYNFRPKWSSDGKIIYFSSSEERFENTFKIELIKEKFEFKEEIIDSLYEERKKEKKEEKEEKVEVRIDFEDIEKRVERVTQITGTEEYPLLTVDSKKLFFVSDILGKKDIWSYDIDKKKLTQLTTDGKSKSKLSISEDGKVLYFLSGSKINSIKLKDKKQSTLSFTARVDLDFKKEREQMLKEAWWLLDNYFYDPNLHGIDWKEVGEKYYPILEHIRTKPIFVDLIREMIGKLGASHLNIYPPGDGLKDEKWTGYLGIELDYETLEQKGLFKIKSTLSGSPADKVESKLKAGDYILAVDGKDLSDKDNFYQHLNGKVGKKVILLVNSKPNKKNAREIAIKPINKSKYLSLAYDNWVKQNKKKVHQLSDNKLGYIHLNSMDMQNVEKFKKELAGETREKDGLILDVRYNNGGWTSVFILSILARQPFVMKTFRERDLVSENKIRSLAWEKPIILLVNEHSFSNAEIFTQGFKTLGLGKIVGVPTPGGVISTSNEWKMMDGSTFRRPSWGTYTTYGENLEGKGRMPDIYVENNLEGLIKGKDVQLERAVKELLKEL